MISSIINNFSVWEKSQDVAVQAKTPQKQRRSNKKKGSVSLKEKQIKVLYNKDSLEKSSPEALLNSLAKQYSPFRSSINLGRSQSVLE